MILGRDIRYLKNTENAFIIALALLPLAMLLALRSNSFTPRFSSSLLSDPQLSCRSGRCFLKDQGSALVRELSLGKISTAKMGDTLITLGEETVIEVTFDDGTLSILKGTGQMRLSKGAKDLSVDESSSGASPVTLDEVKSESNLFYIGNIPMKLLVPALNVPIIFKKFPANLRVVVGAEAESLEWFNRSWTLIEKGTSSKRGDAELYQFKPEAAGSRHFAVTLAFLRPGKYRMVPASADQTSSDGIAFEVLGSGAMEDKIKGLLQGIDQSPNGAIDLRSD